jgi:tRNA-binding protein
VDAQSTEANRPFEPASLSPKPEVRADTFFTLDLRVGRITEVEPFPEARNPAWRLKVDFGPAVGVLATSAHVTNYAEHELLGRVVIGAINLGTKRVAGFSSEFLVLGALEPDGTVRLLEVHGVAPGAPVA